MNKHSKGGRLFAAFMALSVLTGSVNLPVMKKNVNTITASAAEMETGSRILVDLTKNDGRGAAQAPYANNWIVDGDTSASTTISGLSITLSASGGSLRIEDNKKLHFYNDKYSRLMCDGATVDADGGGTLKLTISGLSDGTHSIKTYHGATGNETTSTQSVTVNGTKSTGIKCPNQVLADDDAGISYTTFTGTSVTVEIKPEGSGNAWLNAFEIDGGDPINGINHTYPLDQEMHLQTDVGLSWEKGSNAASHNVYIGTSYDSVFNATTNSSEFKGNQMGTSYKLDNSYTSLAPYYWRVDTVDSNGNVIKGSVYSFYTARLAFPTAEGYGRFARGGRGGNVLHVTNLNDSGEGSLRWALEENSGPRIIVFDVGGVIALKDTLWIRQDYGDVYVAGQTAPGDGITLINHDFGGLGASDIIIRDIRVRVGDSNGQSTGGMGLGSCNHSIVDHCSISWATDEGFSSRSARNITFQWNIIGESLNNSVHYGVGGDPTDHTGTERHAFAASIGGDIGSFHHNLLVHCTDRNWSLAGGLEQSAQEYAGYLDITNNVVYDWQNRTTDGGINSVNFVSNYYKMGVNSRDMALIQLSDEICPGIMKAYVAGNKMTDIKGNTKLDPSQDAWSAGRAEVTSSAQTQQQAIRTSPMWEDYIEMQSADDAYKSVLASAGAGATSSTGRDYIDSRYVDETTKGSYTFTGSRDGLNGIIDSQNDVGGYPNSSTFEHSTDGMCNEVNDTDRDGMPNTWETEHGLNPNDASDGAQISLSTEGYTNVEMFLNELAGDDVLITQLKRDPLAGELISSLEIKDVTNYNSWSIQQNLTAGSPFFGDREVTYKTIPSYLEGAEYVVTAADSKLFEDDLAELTAAKDIDVYVALDQRVETAGSWLNGWEIMDETVINSKDVTFTLYKKTLSAGETITLGTNNQSSGCVNYTVIVTEHQESPQKVRGDVNADGQFSVADIVVMQKWLLCVPDTHLADLKAGDLCEDNKLDVFDLCLMRRELLLNK